MALTESKMLPLGSPCPEFELTNVIDEQSVSNRDFIGQPLLVMFICNHCPYVKHVQPELIRLAADFHPQPIAMVAIQSNDVVEYPDDNPDNMKAEADRVGYRFAYLFDATQQVAERFSAACTPDFFLFDANHHLVYRGRLDETRPRRIQSGVYDSNDNQPTGADLRRAIAALLKQENPLATQYPSIGCNIKWRSR